MKRRLVEVIWIFAMIGMTYVYTALATAAAMS